MTLGKKGEWEKGLGVPWWVVGGGVPSKEKNGNKKGVTTGAGGGKENVTFVTTKAVTSSDGSNHRFDYLAILS